MHLLGPCAQPADSGGSIGTTAIDRLDHESDTLLLLEVQLTYGPQNPLREHRLCHLCHP